MRTDIRQHLDSLAVEQMRECRLWTRPVADRPDLAHGAALICRQDAAEIRQLHEKTYRVGDTGQPIGRWAISPVAL